MNRKALLVAVAWLTPVLAFAQSGSVPVFAPQPVGIRSTITGLPLGESSTAPLYVSSTGGGGGAVTGNQSNAAGGTTGSNNIGSNSYNYGWNGSAWSQSLSDSAGRMVLVGAGTAGTPAGGVLTIQGIGAGGSTPINDNNGSLTVDTGTPGTFTISNTSFGVTQGTNPWVVGGSVGTLTQGIATAGANSLNVYIGGSVTQTTQGTSANAAAVSGNPFLLGCEYLSTPQTLTTGQGGYALCDTNGRLAVNVNSSVLPINASTSALQSNVQSAPGTSATTATGVQGVTNGVPIPRLGYVLAASTTTAPAASGTATVGPIAAPPWATRVNCTSTSTTALASLIAFHNRTNTNATVGTVTSPAAGVENTVDAPISGASGNGYGCQATATSTAPANFELDLTFRASN